MLWRVSPVARLAEASRPTVRRGVAELDQPADPRGRIRQHEGPKRRRDTYPGLLQALDRLVEPDTRSGPESPLRWTCKSTRELAGTLTTQGHPVSDDTVGRLLKQQGYRLQRTVKTLAGAQHPDRDAQLPYLNEQARTQLADAWLELSRHTTTTSRDAEPPPGHWVPCRIVRVL